MSEPRFELGISDPIANHITTRPRGIYWNWGKNFARFSISNMIYLYGLIQPMGGRNRVKDLTQHCIDGTLFILISFCHSLHMVAFSWTCHYLMCPSLTSNLYFCLDVQIEIQILMWLYGLSAQGYGVIELTFITIYTCTHVVNILFSMT